MEQRVKNAIAVFIKAIDTRTLAKGTCVACAVGNLVAAGKGAKITKVEKSFGQIEFESTEKNWFWKQLFMTSNGRQETFPTMLEAPIVMKDIESTEFTWEELAQIEYAFETNSNINFHDYHRFNSDEILNDQIAGLEAVIEVMLSFSNDTKTDVKKVFTEKVKS